MANLTFADTHNMVAYLSKSDASARFNQKVDFLNAQVIQYVLMVNPAIYVLCIKQFWVTVSIKKVKDVVKLQALIDRKKVVLTEDITRQDLRLDDADGVDVFLLKRFLQNWHNEFSCSVASAIICLALGRKFNFSKYIFDSMVRNVDSPSKFLMYPSFLQVFITNQVDDLSSDTIKYTSPVLTQKVFSNMRRIGKGFSGVETQKVQPLATTEEEDEEDEVPAAPTPPSLTNEPTPPSNKPITTPPQTQSVSPLPLHPQAQPAPPSLPPQEQPTTTSTFDMTLLDTLLETCTTLNCYGCSRGCIQTGRRIKVIDTDEDIKLVDMETKVDLVFDDEEVTMTMAQTLIKMKAKEARLLDEQMAKRLHDEEVEQAAAREKQE
nr:hypothetical protein [Tanacetum cinerariifolium]